VNYLNHFKHGNCTLPRPAIGGRGHAALDELPAEVADNIAFRNGERLAAWALGQRLGQ